MNERIHFITHFDSDYAAQGMAMMASLHKFGWQDIRVLPLDDSVKPTLIKIGIPCGLWRMSDITGKFSELRQARENRSHREWCWSLEPAWCAFNLHIVDDGDIVVYTDADSFYFADPVPTIRSVMEHADVALSPHHFPPGQEHKERSVGHWNFGCGVFRSCDLTRRVVGEWLDQTLAKCDEFGAGDQIYLDQWPEKLGGRLAELPPGMNLGPWSLAEAVCDIDGNLMHMKTGERHTTIFPLISYHFHETRRGTGRNPVQIKGESWNLTNYDIHPSTRECVYEPYIRELKRFL